MQAFAAARSGIPPLIDGDPANAIRLGASPVGRRFSVVQDTIRKTPVQAQLSSPAPSPYLTLRTALRRLRAAMLGGKTDTGVRTGKFPVDRLHRGLAPLPNGGVGWPGVSQPFRDRNRAVGAARFRNARFDIKKRGPAHFGREPEGIQYPKGKYLGHVSLTCCDAPGARPILAGRNRPYQRESHEKRRCDEDAGRRPPCFSTY